MALTESIAWLGKHIWIAQIFFTLFAASLIQYIEIKFYKHIYQRLKKTTRVWDDALVFSLHRPFIVFLWIIAVYVILYFTVLGTKSTNVIGAINIVRNIGAIFAFTWFFVRFIGSIEKKLARRDKRKQNKIDVTTLHAICQLLRLAVALVALLIGLQLIGVPLTGIWAFGGFGGLAIGFAAKDLLANFFGGLMIFIDRPFSVGDWIRSAEKNIEGTVEHIGWRLTKIRTFDKRELYVPNAIFSTISIENPSRMTNRRINAIINLRYDDAEKISVILQDIEDMLKQHPGIDNNQLIMVNLVECASWSLNFMIYAFTVTTAWAEFQKVQQEVFLEVLKIVAKHKAECAFPTTTLNIPNE